MLITWRGIQDAQVSRFPLTTENCIFPTSAQDKFAILFPVFPPMQGSVLDLGWGEWVEGERDMDTLEGVKE